MSWITPGPDGVVLNVRVVPRASRNEIGGVLNDALKIRLQAPPVEGKANTALTEFLAAVLGVPRRAVVILAGETARIKRLKILGATAEQVTRALQS
jgi:uncharacterized protein (TIGR00251 family)